MSNEKEDDKGAKDELVFLTLGDGDFTWSLDLARYLASSNGFRWRKRRLRLIASGIDKLEVLRQKYRNADCVLREIERLREKSDESLTVEVQHGINAIVARESSVSSLSKAHVVIFNHPHLGTEDAALHSQFLCHLFHSVSHFWLVESGVFHLTLVKGQFDRWDCEQAAVRHRMELLDRCPFDPNPLLITYPVYQHRRHQTGKSFASKTMGSETVTYVRQVDKTANREKLTLHKLPWFSVDDKTMDREIEEQMPFTCPCCSKSFREERSLKNHVKSKHFIASQDKKRKRHDAVENIHLTCSYCHSTPEPRAFSSSEALQDHIRAKHDAIHTMIAPDWSQTTKNLDRATTSAEPRNFGECSVCGQIFVNERGEAEHIAAFHPSETQSGTHAATLQCRFCLKFFRQKRSQLQHENFCPSRPTIESLTR